MLRVALKGLLGHKLRFALTALSVVLGVAFIAGTFVLTDSMNNAFSGLFDNIYESIDVTIRAEDPVGQGFDGPPMVGTSATMPEEVLDEVGAVDGVARAAGSVEGFAQFIDPDGEPIGGQAPTFGFSWEDDDPTLTLREGAAPSAPDQVTMDAGTARRHEFEVGDRVDVLFSDGIRTFTITAITGFGDADNLLGATIATFELRTAQELFGKVGRFDSVSVVAEEGVSPEDLRDRIDAILAGRSIAVATAQDESADQQAEIAEALGFFNTALLAFGGVALFVGAFIIANTFSIVVAQRTREFALLRAVGASGRQIRLAVLIEAVVLGLLSSVVGLLAGVGFAIVLKGALAAFGLELPAGGTIIATRTIVVAFLVGTIITTVSSLGPARRASRVAPIEAMRGTGEAAETSIARRTTLGVVATLFGITTLLIGLLTDLLNPLALVGLGAALTMLGVAMLAPLLASPVAVVLGALPSRLGLPGRLAQRNAQRNPVRTASTASALMIGLALVSLVTIMAASITAEVGDTLDEQFRTDFILSSASAGGFGTLPPGIASELSERPEIAAVSPLRLAPWFDGTDTSFAVGVEPSVIDQLVELGVSEGDITDLSLNTVFVKEGKQEEHGVEVGDILPMTFPDGARVEAEVVGIYAKGDYLFADYLLSLDTVAAHIPQAFDFNVLANAAPGTDLSEAAAAVEAVVAGYPVAQVQNQAEFKQSQEDQINQILSLMTVLLALAVIIALLGIANTLALAVFERTREIGLLRAVGMLRKQARRMVVWESVMVAVFGAVLGVAVGTFFGWAIVQALGEDGLRRLVLPAGQLFMYVVVAGLAGVVAAIFPAWRAARLDVLEAVTTE